jgi:hypothetical protein
VLSFFSSRQNWDSPNPSPAGKCAPTPRFWGERHTRWRERGWDSPNSDEGNTLWYSLYVLCACDAHWECILRIFMFILIAVAKQRIPQGAEPRLYIGSYLVACRRTNNISVPSPRLSYASALLSNKSAKPFENHKCNSQSTNIISLTLKNIKLMRLAICRDIHYPEHTLALRRL